MILVFGMILDAIFGEPKWLWDRVPHPAVLTGRLINWCDRSFNKGDQQRLMGTMTIVEICIAAAIVGWVLEQLPGGVVDVIVLGILLAHKSLVTHITRVGDALRLSLGDGKRAVQMVVGRDTKDMSRSQVARAAIESAAENLSDGVIAPIFWFWVAGLPGLLIYKAVNTADSMIGYRTERHAAFGWASARLDDLLNLIPARLTAALIWLVTGRPDPRPILQEAPLHRSPNAGWPEAALAHGLDIALSGPRSYDGTVRDEPFVNAGGEHDLTPDHVDMAVRVLWHCWWGVFALAALWAVVF
ncbi:adenosylcobinamide-phosphate synthase CbiB [Yoonia sp. SS1-5]|uniref:Cobalamin biosynthesis protein CobD n=1 Tax=Yoonia rhodophyticola TaxID=3137370 RepID=A0ABZ3JBF3_9RHOB